jgi:hypothetical protein
MHFKQYCGQKPLAFTAIPAENIYQFCVLYNRKKFLALARKTATYLSGSVLQESQEAS